MRAPYQARHGISFNFGDVPVRVRGTFFVSALLLALAGGQDSLALTSIWIVIVFASVLWHELGHSFAAISFGLKPEIELGGMGGLTDLGATAAGLRWWKDVVISVAGPAAGLLAGGAIWLAGRGVVPESAAAHYALHSAIWANVGWSLLNLLPILPYDGGLALRAVLRARFPERGGTAAQVVSLVVGGAAFFVALGVRMYWAAYLAGMAAVAAWRFLANQHFEKRLDAAWDALYDGRRSEAAAEVAAIQRRAPDDWIRARAVELSGWIALHDADTAAAREALKALSPGSRPSAVLEATIDTLDGKETSASLRALDPAMLLAAWRGLVAAWIGQEAKTRVERLVTDQTAAVLDRNTLVLIAADLFHGTEYSATLVVTTRAFAAHGNPLDAYNAACALSRLGQPEEALAWLERAVEAGYRDLPGLLADDDLAVVRALAGFAALAERLKAAGS